MTRHQPEINKTKLHIGDFNNDFSRDLDISTLNIVLTDSTKNILKMKSRKH